MCSQVVTRQVGLQRGSRQETSDTSGIREFLKMNPSSFTAQNAIEDPENLIEQLQKVLCHARC